MFLKNFEYVHVQVTHIIHYNTFGSQFTTVMHALVLHVRMISTANNGNPSKEKLSDETSPAERKNICSLNGIFLLEFLAF